MNEPISALTEALADRYRIERELGQGGMATVYIAEDLKHARRVAVKVLHPDLAAALGAERFLSEIRTTANLQHPHILALHDCGAAGGFLYYVMPYVDGESLRRPMRERASSEPMPSAIRALVENARTSLEDHRRDIRGIHSLTPRANMQALGRVADVSAYRAFSGPQERGLSGARRRRARSSCATDHAD